jgi:hypothetical protein
MGGWEHCGGADGVHTCQLDPSLGLHNGNVIDEVTAGTRLRGDTRWAAHAMSSSLSGGSVAPVEELLSRW